MAEIELEEARKFLESKLEDLRALPIDFASYRYQKHMYGDMAGKSLIEIEIHTKAHRQTLLRKLKHLFHDAPSHVRFELFDTDKKPELEDFPGLPLIGWESG
jgi:hypothetical protein